MADPVNPQWRKVLLSGSNAYVHALTASGLDVSPGDPSTEKVLVVGAGGAIYSTGSYGSGGGGGGTADDIVIAGAAGSTAINLLLGNDSSPTSVYYDSGLTFIPNPNKLIVNGDVSATWISASEGIQHTEDSGTTISLASDTINIRANSNSLGKFSTSGVDLNLAGLDITTAITGNLAIYPYNEATPIITNVSAAIAAAAAAGNDPGGSDTYIQYNDGDSFAGISNFTFDKSSTNPTVTIQGGTGAGNQATLFITASNSSQASLHLKSLRPHIWFEEHDGSPDFYLLQNGSNLVMGTSDSANGPIAFNPSNGSITASIVSASGVGTNLIGTASWAVNSTISTLAFNANNATNATNATNAINATSAEKVQVKHVGPSSTSVFPNSDNCYLLFSNPLTLEETVTSSLFQSDKFQINYKTGAITASANFSSSLNIYAQKFAVDNNIFADYNSGKILIGDAGSTIPLQLLGSSVTVGSALTASIVSASSNMYASTADAAGATYNTLMVDTTTGKFYHTGSYGGGGGGGGFPFTGDAVITGSLEIVGTTSTGSITITSESIVGTVTENDRPPTDKTFELYSTDDQGILKLYYNNNAAIILDPQINSTISSPNSLFLDSSAVVLGSTILPYTADSTNFRTNVLGGLWVTGSFGYSEGRIHATSLEIENSITASIISASGNIYIQSGSAAYTDIVYSSQFTTASYLYFEDDLNPEQSANNTTLASIAGINFIMDTNDNDTHQFYWSYGGLTPATSTPIMTLSRGGQLSGSSLSFIGKTGNFGVDVTSPIISASTELGTDADIYAPNLPAGVDNTVVIKDSDGYLRTDEIDPRVWGSTLVDVSGTPSTSWIPRFSDTNTVTSDNTLAFSDGTLRIGGKAGLSATHVLYMPPILGSTTTTYKSGIEVNASDFSAEGHSTGEIFNAVNGASLTRTEIVYYGKAGAWAVANATTAAPASGMLGLAINTGVSQTAALTKGYMAVAASQIGGTYNTGSTLYLGTSSGMFQASAPGNVGHTIRKVGWVVNGGLGKSGDILVRFDPSNDFITN